MLKPVVVGYTEESLRENAKALAAQLHLEINHDKFPQLTLTSERLELRTTRFLPMAVDFEDVSRKRRLEGKKQGLIQACKPDSGVTILDVTAGWGRDAAILAGFGANVIMIERNPIMAALLKDGLKRLDESSSLKPLLSLHHEDAKSYLTALSEPDYPEVIYMDPMHPTRQKSALVKKEMQLLQQLLGADEDALELLESSLKRAKNRVVVKWPQRQPPLKPSQISYPGKTIRFDVYKT
ncbi:class I SAM-dependent methyltransferase [Legionella yabuuchiae]|uniref:class I SAM-dependent methyltransferase n=1 Tax=Legionella yabuuchiae TaxID=376727 RepID=UPI0010568BAA|nr:class I SAM-dependent methyltransferase [Legionella yabuuchiae]